MQKAPRHFASLPIMLTVLFGCDPPQDGAVQVSEPTPELGQEAGGLGGGTHVTPTGKFAGIGRNENGCTTTLISNWAALTAAHCVDDGQPDTFELDNGLGSIEGTAFVHPLYDTLVGENYDYAVIRFPHSIFDDSNVDSTGLVPFALAERPFATNVGLTWYGNGPSSSSCVPYNWGTVDMTKWTNVPFVENLEDYSYLVDSTTNELCGGDSGGPTLDSNDKIVSVHSMVSSVYGWTQPIYRAYDWIKQNMGRPELPGNTWGHCVYYTNWIGGAYYSTQGNASSFSGYPSFENSISAVWVKKGYRVQLYDGTSYSTLLGTYRGFVGSDGNCDESGCVFDLTGTSANNSASSAKCESDLPGDTWGYCIGYARYGDGGYFSTQGNVGGIPTSYPTWNNAFGQLWVKRDHTATLYPHANYVSSSVQAPYWPSALSFDGYTGDWCNSYGCLWDLQGTLAERTTSSIECD